MNWLVSTLRTYPELAIFLALAIGFWIGPKKVGGFSLGNVTATLLAAVLIGQVHYGAERRQVHLLHPVHFRHRLRVGPQFFAGLSREGPKQIASALIVLAFCLIVPYLCALAAGLDVSYAAGRYPGSQTISATIGVGTDQISRLGLSPEKTRAYANAIPIGYAVTSILRA